MNTSSFSDDEPPKRRRSTVPQLELFIRYMVANPDLLAHSHSRPLDISEKVDTKWNSLKNILKHYGPDKNVSQWKHTWRDLVRKMREKRKKGETMKDGDLIMKALVNAKRFSFHNIEPWCKDKMWIPLDKSKVRVAVKPVAVKLENEDPLIDGGVSKNTEYYVEVGFLNNTAQNQPTENGQAQETQQGVDNIPMQYIPTNVGQNNQDFASSEDEQAASPASSRSTLPSPPPQRKKKQKTTYYPVPEVEEDGQETSDSGQCNRDIDVLSTLNKFIEYEKEKDKLRHEREMTRIQQADKLLDVMDKIANVFVDLAPSIKNFLDMNSTNC